MIASSRNSFFGRGVNNLSKRENDKEITEIEKEIIHMISLEYSNSNIADELNYSKRMIEYYIKGIASKLNVKTRVGIVAKSYKRKILKIKDVG